MSIAVSLGVVFLASLGIFMICRGKARTGIAQDEVDRFMGKSETIAGALLVVTGVLLAAIEIVIST